MSDEYSITTNFQRESDDPRAAGEFEYRMGRVRERQEDLEQLALTTDPPKWYDVALRCVDCERVTYRPPLSEKPCAWCGGRLAHG